MSVQRTFRSGPNCNMNQFKISSAFSWAASLMGSCPKLLAISGFIRICRLLIRLRVTAGRSLESTSAPP